MDVSPQENLRVRRSWLLTDTRGVTFHVTIRLKNLLAFWFRQAPASKQDVDREVDYVLVWNLEPRRGGCLESHREQFSTRDATHAQREQVGSRGQPCGAVAVLNRFVPHRHLRA